MMGWMEDYYFTFLITTIFGGIMFCMCWVIWKDKFNALFRNFYMRLVLLFDEIKDRSFTWLWYQSYVARKNLSEWLLNLIIVVQKVKIQHVTAIWVGTWGRKSGGPQNAWSFVLEEGYKMKKITIDHGDDVIYSLIFTAEDASTGESITSKKFGGWNGGDKVFEITLDSDEEVVEIKGSTGTKLGYTVICSLTVKTNKTTYGPFGGKTAYEFSFPWDKGSLVGFYGLCGYFIDGIAVYLKPAHDEEIMRIGTWGTTQPGGPQNVWSYQLERNHRLKTITIDHGDLIYSLMFTTQYQGLTYTYPKIGGWNGGDKVSEVTFGWDEEIIAISGTAPYSRGDYSAYQIISSITFVTNQKTYGPFGDVRGSLLQLDGKMVHLLGFTVFVGIILIVLVSI